MLFKSWGGSTDIVFYDESKKKKKKQIRVDVSLAHRPMRPARYRSTALQIKRSIVSSLCRMTALAIDR